MYLFAHNCSHIQSSGDKNSPSGRTEVSISLVHHNYPSPKSIVQKVLYKVRKSENQFKQMNETSFTRPLGCGYLDQLQSVQCIVKMSASVVLSFVVGIIKSGIKR